MKTLIASLGFVLLVTACGAAEEPADQAATKAPAESHDMSSMGSSDNEVRMKLVAFTPGDLEVPAGTEVTWTQDDAGAHTATSGTVAVADSGEITTKPDGTFASEELKTGETFSHTFDKPGTFDYFCEIHPATMRGQIKVS